MIELSIIIISYNTRDILHDCLESVYRNKPQSKFEVIVVDNNSQDGTLQMLAEDFSEVILIANKSNRGFAAANNQGFEIARGKFSLLLNSDTIVLEDVLENSLQYMLRNNEVGMMGCRVLNVDKSMQQTCFMWPSLLNVALLASGLGMLFPDSPFIKRERMQGWNRDTYREVEAITGCYLLVRMEATTKVGLLDEDFYFYGEETDWCRRFRECGYKVMFAPVGEIIHLGGASGQAWHYSRKVLLSQALVRMQRKHNGLFCAVITWLLLLFEVIFKGSAYAVLSLKNFNNSEKQKHHLQACKQNLGALCHFNQAWAKPGKRKQKRIFAVASSGGHWAELLLLQNFFNNYEAVYISTQFDLRKDVTGSKFYLIKDVNRWKKRLIPIALLQTFWIVFRERPDVIITTGALPGLIMVVWGKVFRLKTVWIDSIANCEELSLSGKAAKYFATLRMTQWEHLADVEGGVEYSGKVLG